MTIQAAMDGHLLSVLDGRVVAPHLASGSLVRVLEDWCPPFARFLCLTGARNKTTAPSLLIHSLEAWAALAVSDLAPLRGLSQFLSPKTAACR
jgi:DNA-binding transcriptional LysR family regulator